MKMGCCPCCFGFSLQVACKIISILDMVAAMFGAITGGVLLVTLIFYRDEILSELYHDERLGRHHELRQFMEKPIPVQYSFIVFTILICVLELIVAFILLNGARKRNAVKCTLWFRIHCVLLILGIIFTILAIISSHEKLFISIAGISGLIYQAYALWIVRAYIQQLNKGYVASAKLRRVFEDYEEQAEPLQDMSSNSKQ